MNYIFRYIILFLVFYISVITPSTASEIYSVEQITPAIVYLHRSQIRTIPHEGIQKEIWLKNPTNGSLEPFFETVAGTGFLVSDEGNMYLITAWHVAHNLNKTAKISLRGEGDTPMTFDLTELTPLQEDNIPWISHKQADVALIKIIPSTHNIEKYLQNRFIPLKIMISSEVAPSRETQLTVIGFPKSLGVEERFSPLTLTTNASSGLLRLPLFDTGTKATFFVLQAPGIGGYSGAPVFDISQYKMGPLTTTGSGTVCYGLIHGTISDETGGKLAVVVPASKIVELIKSAK